MFSLLPRSAQRAVRRGASQAAKLMSATTKATRQANKAVRKAEKVVRQTKKTVRATTKAVKALKPAPARKAPGRFVEIDGARIHYIARGRGRPVVLLHGNGTMAEDYEICGLIDRLATRYRVIAIDRPGFGHSERPRHTLWSAQAQARLIHRVLEKLKVERPVVVGHSWGTLVTLALATAEQRELRGLVLLSGYYYPGRRADVTMSAPLAIPGIGDAARSMVPSALLPALAAQSFRQVFRPQPVPARFTARFPAEIAMSQTQLRASTEDASTMNAAANLLQHSYVKLRIPVTILAGEADAVVKTEEQSHRLHGDVAGSTLVLLPKLGHMIHYFARGAICRAVDHLMQPAGPRAKSAGEAASTRMARGPGLPKLF